MKTIVRSWALGTVVMSTTGAWATVYDLTADWSETSNPNGVWSLASGGNLLTAVTGWTGDPWSMPQQGWQGGFTPFAFKSNGTELFTHDWTAGTVVVHTANPGDPSPTTFNWTSPGAGTVDISGFLWEGRDIGRGNSWSVDLNAVSLTDGEVSSGDPYDSSNPFDMATGSGGAGALTGVTVGAGDVISLRLQQLPGVGDYVACNMTVDFHAAVPEPISTIGLAMGLLAMARRKRRVS